MSRPSPSDRAAVECVPFRTVYTRRMYRTVEFRVVFRFLFPPLINSFHRQPLSLLFRSLPRLSSTVAGGKRRKQNRQYVRGRVISGTMVAAATNGGKMGGEWKGWSGLKRLPLNVIQPAKGRCINKEKRRRSRKGRKSAGCRVVGFSRINPLYMCTYTCARASLLAARTYTRAHGGSRRGNPRLVTSKASSEKLQMHERMG